MPYCYFKEQIETFYKFETHFFQFCHDRDPLLDQRFREAPSALPFLSGVKMSSNCFSRDRFSCDHLKICKDVDLKRSIMPLAGRDLINQDSRGIRSSLINLRFFKWMEIS